MEKNVAKHVLADVFWVTHHARGQRETKLVYELLQRSYRSRRMEWHSECLELAWEQYIHWVNSGSPARTVEGRQPHNHSPKQTRVPTYPIRLEKRGRNEWEFAWPGEVLNLAGQLDLGIDYLETGDLRKARRIFRNIISECPYFIDALNYLALTEWNANNLIAAEDYYTKAYEIGHAVIKPDFKGKLPWLWTDNRPFLRTLHGLAMVKLRRNDLADTIKLLNWMVKLDPDDYLGAKIILEDIKHGSMSWDD